MITDAPLNPYKKLCVCFVTVTFITSLREQDEIQGGIPQSNRTFISVGGVKTFLCVYVCLGAPAVCNVYYGRW